MYGPLFTFSLEVKLHSYMRSTVTRKNDMTSALTSSPTSFLAVGFYRLAECVNNSRIFNASVYGITVNIVRAFFRKQFPKNCVEHQCCYAHASHYHARVPYWLGVLFNWNIINYINNYDLIKFDFFLPKLGN